MFGPESNAIESGREWKTMPNESIATLRGRAR